MDLKQIPTNTQVIPLNIKLGSIKQFLKALDKNSNCFQYLIQVFLHLLEGEIKDVFVYPDIKQLIKD